VLGLALGPANQHDLKLAIPTLDSIPVHRPQPARRRPQHLCADKAYDSEEFRHTLARRHFISHIKTKGNDQLEQRQHRHGKARRWVNERTQSWFNRFRRILIRWEKKERNYYNELMFVAAWIAFREAGVLG